MQQIFGDKPLKSYRLWLLIGFLSYSLAGFVLLPYVLKTQLIKYVDGILRQQASLEVASFNPFLLRLRLHNLQLVTPEQAPLLSLGELVVDFDSFGLFKRAWQFSDISLSELEVFAEIDSAGKLNLNRLVPPPSDAVAAPPEVAPVETASATALPRLILQNIAIKQSRVHFKQLDRAEPFTLDLNPLNFNIAHFSTLPEDGGQFSFDAKFSAAETLEFNGALQVDPLALSGHIALNNIALSRGADYLQEMLLFSVKQGTLSIDSDFALDKSGPAQSLALQASNIGIAVQQLQLETLAPIEPLLTLSSITLNKASFAWPEQKMLAQSLVVDSGLVHSWLTADKIFNYTQLIKSSDTQAEPSPAHVAPEHAKPIESQPLQLRLEQVQLKALQLNFDDRSLREPARQSIELVEISLSPFTLEPGAEFDLQAQLNINATGSTTIAGKVGAMPPMATLAIGLRELPLPPINSYLHDTILLNMTSGSVDADLQLDYQNENSKTLALRGDIDIKQLDTFDLADQESWLHWQNLAIKDLNLQLQPARLNIASVELVRPYFDSVIFDNGDTRLLRMLVSTAKPAGDEQENNPENASSMPITIAKFTLLDGSMDYKDFNLPLNFATHIHDLQGQATDISSVSSTATELTLDGKIDQYGTAKISAASQLSAPRTFSAVKVDLSNVDITSASSYSGKFAGYAIDAGTLSLNVDYRIKQGQMLGDNHLLLEHLTLGEAVDSPDAVSLPLKLAVALMKDINGNIDLDLPVAGDLNNPQVKIGGIVWKAFTNLLIKVAASPFTMIGGLFEGGDSSGLESVVFSPGSSELSAIERQELDRLVEGLLQKPELALAISACYQPEADTLALQTQHFNRAYRLASGADESAVAPLSYQSKRLKKMYVEAFGPIKLTQLETQSKQSLIQQGTDGGEASALAAASEALIDAQIQTALIGQQVLGVGELSQLATQRGTAVYSYLSVSAENKRALPLERLQLNAKAEAVSADGNGIVCPLILSAR
ncbi:MAG: DUF748 domain-containing protein [Gammaproteobacteria bacterium]|nr:DUF748 domain-containing protein [Gammaproteobacteria bacterium]MBQ0839243.1 DUF748 domain-containing protein [Gammaproteobacteria bacterium]